jgi:hypothetical protein
VALKRGTKKHIADEIEYYHESLDRIKELREEILYSVRKDEAGPVAGGDIYTSQTERKATAAAQSKLLNEMHRITKAIEDTYRKAKTDARKVIYVKYGLTISWDPPEDLIREMDNYLTRVKKNRYDLKVEEMAEILSMDRSTFCRYLTGFSHGVAEKLGWW